MTLKTVRRRILWALSLAGLWLPSWAAVGPVKIAPAAMLSPALQAAPAALAPALPAAAPAVAALPAVPALPIAAAPTPALAPAARAIPAAAESGSEDAASAAERLAAKLNAFYSGAKEKFAPIVVPPEPGADHGSYIVPNEQNTNLYAPVLRGKGGALVSVGTFRALNAGLLGDFSHIIQFDYDSKTTAFNRAHLGLIRVSRDRFEYLTRLFDKPLAPALLADARRGVLSDGQFLEQLLALPDAKIRRPEASAVQEILASLPEDRRPWFSPHKTTVQRLIAAVLKFRTTPEQWESTYFGSDRLFAELRRLVRGKRVIPVNGDLAGVKAMPALARALRAAAVSVSAVDFSNALQYFVDERSEQFLKNLRGLPLSEDASALFTVKTFQPRASDTGAYFADRFMPVPSVTSDDWLYLAVPASELIRAGDAGSLNSRKDFMAYMTSLHRNADPRKRSTGLIVPRSY